MNKKKLIFMIIEVCCLILSFILKDRIGYFPNEKVFLSSVASVCMDKEGNKIIADNSGQRLLKVDKEGNILFLIQGGSEEKKGFYCIKKVITDKEGNIYLLDNVGSAKGSWTVKEVIKKFSKEGKFLEILYEEDFKNQTLTGNIYGLYERNGEICYIQKGEDKLLVKDMGGNLLQEYKYPNAELYLLDFAFEPETNTLYFVSKRGEIGKFIDKTEAELLYEVKGASNPRDIGFIKQGELYVADVGLRQISRLEERELVPVLFQYQEVEEDFVSTLEERKQSPIFYSLETGNGFITCYSDCYLTYEDENFIYKEQFSFKEKEEFLNILSNILLIISGCIILSWLYRGVQFLILSGSFVLKFSTIVMIGTVFITIVFSMITLKDIQKRLTMEMFQRAEAVAKMTAEMIPVDAFCAIQEPSDFMGKDYQKVREQVRRNFINADGTLLDLYCVLYTIEDDMVISRYSLEENLGCHYPNEWLPNEEKRIMETGIGKRYPKTSTSEGNFIYVIEPIFDSNYNAIGVIEVGADLDSFNHENRNLLIELFLNIVVIAVIIILVSLEAIIFIDGRKQYLASLKQNKNSKLPTKMIRTAVFLIFFITNITTGFMPIYAMNIVKETILGIPKEILAAIPLSVEVLTGAIFSVYGGIIIRKLGYKKAAVFSGILFTIGLFTRGIFANIWFLIAGNAIQGCGWGILLLIMNILIAEEKDEEERENGFSGYNAASLSGVNCGVVFGGFLLNWLDYQMVFFITAIFSVLVLLFISIYLKDGTLSEQEKEVSSISFFRFITSPRISFYFIGIVIPIVASGYYINYLYPIIGSEFGISETNIGYSYLLNGLCVILLGNILSNKLTERMNKRKQLLLASAIYGITFFLVAYQQNIWMLLASLILLGISDSFGFSAQSSYYTELEEVKAYGYEKAMGIYNLFENIAETGGAFLFSYVLLIGLKEGLIIIAAFVIGLSIIFGFIDLARKKKKKAKRKERKENYKERKENR